MSTYLGWTIVTMPTSPPAPASFEFALNSLVGVNTNPFTAQQQVYDWQANFTEASASYAAMTKAQAAAWVAFLKLAKGPLCVFQFPAAVCAAFPESLTTDGSTPRYWRLKSTQAKWSIKLGPIYGLTFEVREAL